MTNGPCILAVDDDERWRIRLSGYLARMGIKVVMANNRYAAENMLEGNESIVAVISDDSMPRPGQGVGLCAWMRAGPERLKSMPFILHTGDHNGRAKEAIEMLDGVFCQKNDQGALRSAVQALMQ